MLTRRRCATGSILGVAGITAVFLVFATGAFSRSAASPADKVVAAGDKTLMTSPNGMPITILGATMTTSKPTDLILQVSLECSILTTVTAGGSTTFASAEGQVRVWVTVDTKIVPVQDVSSPPQNTSAGGDDSDKAVFCERVHEVTFIDGNGDDTLSQYQKTKNANAFNWLRLNVGSGTHTIRVHAEFFTANTTMNPLNSQAYVGNRTLVVEPTKMANDAIISTGGTN